MEVKKEWFEDWFDSPYYHILYGYRDMKEAEFFLGNLINRFDPKENSTIIDLACGKGRHSIYLNSLGFDVTGIDLSPKSIAEAAKHENEHLHFKVGDLRNFTCPRYYDFALNLFTSFGYFDSLETDELVLNRIYDCLKPRGYLLIDFFNASKVSCMMLAEETKIKEGISFNIKKVHTDGKIIKTISFKDNNHDYFFQEKVQTLGLNDFEVLFEKSGFELIDVFGSYDLSPFEELSSDRLILIAQKKDA
jgi:SAM-dependent methyltransferase